jgi:uncharacterized membrane protein YjgN (DUF898 family)
MAEAVQAEDRHGCDFRGSAREWFGIWIVNLLLSIVTLGIYSAWAKVRAKKYFYQNTYIAGRNFDYHATGWQILKGRLIFVAGLIGFELATLVPVLNILVLIGIFFLIPWLLVRALRFNAQMTSWSNVRFRFTGEAGQAFLAHMLYPFLAALSLFTAFPFAERAIKRFTINNHWLGRNGFSFDSGIWPFYRALLLAGVAVIVAGLALYQALVAFVAGSVAIEAAINSDAFSAQPVTAERILYFLPLLLILVVFPPAFTIYGALIRNATIGNMRLDGGHYFQSTVNAGRLVWIAISNAAVTVLSLGLMLPWAKVRMVRYLADQTGIVAKGSLNEFISVLEADATALGDAYADIEAVDIGLPI